MSEDLLEIVAKAGADCDFEFIWTDVDDTVDPPTETPVDLTGFTASTVFRRRDGEGNVLELTSDPLHGIVITASEGVLAHSITATEVDALRAESKRVAFRTILTGPDGKKYPLQEGFLTVDPWTL